MSCPCDSCKYKKLNFKPTEHPHTCPNFNYFFDAFMTAYCDGVLKTEPCDKWEEDPDLRQYGFEEYKKDQSKEGDNDARTR